MKFFLLTRTDDADYDEYDSFVVVAPDEESAREHTKVADGGYSKESWITFATCVELRPEDFPDAFIILGSYVAGC